MSSSRYSCPILLKLEFSRQILEKFANIKLRQNPSNGSRVLSSGQTDGRKDRHTDMTKLIIAFLNFANAPKMDTQDKYGNYVTRNIFALTSAKRSSHFWYSCPQSAHELDWNHALTYFHARLDFLILYRL